MEIGEALTKPLKDISKLVLGTIVALIPIVNFIILGYGFENARKPKELPEFKWKEHWIAGLLGGIIGAIYMIIPMVIVYLLLGNKVPVIFQLGLTPAIGRDILGYVVIALILVIVGSLVAVRAMLEYAKTQNFSEAFNFSKIISEAFKGQYVVKWFVGVIVAAIISAILAIIPIIGAALANYYTTVFFWSYISEA